VGICDAFDAMTSTRPYRAAMPVPQALQRIGGELGRQFAEPPGRHFLALGAEGLLDHIAGHSDEGIPLQQCMTCGPTLVVRREQADGDRVFCHNCGGEYRVARSGDGQRMHAEPTGRRGQATELAPRAVMALIRRFVRVTAVLALSSTAAN
jgi:hypothetical protein